MRKLVFMLLILLVVSFAYAQEQPANNFSYGLTCLIAISDDMVTPGPGLAVGWNNTGLFGPVGLGTYFHFIVPMKKMDEGDLNWGLAASLLTGFSYMVFDNGGFALPATLGFHISGGMFAQGGVATINLGVGANFDFLWRFGNKWQAYGRLLTVYNFGAGGEFLLIPGLGLNHSF